MRWLLDQKKIKQNKRKKRENIKKSGKRVKGVGADVSVQARCPTVVRWGGKRVGKRISGEARKKKKN